jgi:hypothetical protein
MKLMVRLESQELDEELRSRAQPLTLLYGSAIHRHVKWAE